ncbi:transcription antitermination factor NusB [Paracoccus sediminilitoris]|uniref:transcription antitermination factor NusB n=1 Tax=Paracoccus sediminilitoris TaxID=2202419 RepID=UPI000DB9F580|nr:transcription antitermination factor NusB [Paracoccus sediminilitoris]
MSDNEQEGAKRPDRRTLSSAARLYAVQALFQMEAMGQASDRVTNEFRNYRIDFEDRDGPTAQADEELFERIVDHAVMWQSRIDQATDKGLVEKWPIDRLDPVLRAVFRAAGAELVLNRAPFRVIITEYVRLTQAFFAEGKESKFVNAVLDHMARTLQPDSFN